MNQDNYNLTDIPLERLRERRSAKWTTHPADVLPAFVAEMDFPLADPVKEALVEAIRRDDTGYANPAASDLAKSFAGFTARRFGWEVDPELVTATGDVVSGLKSLLGLLTSPGDRVIINPPVYFPFFSIVPETGCETVEVPLLGSGELDLSGIESAFAEGARVMILCSPHNPTGSVPSRESLEELAAIADRYDAWILADEIHAPLTLPGAIHTPFLDVSGAARRRGICVTSASKTFNIAGLGCALFVTAGAGAQDVIERLSPGDKHPGHLGVIAAETAFRHGDEWLDQVISQLDRNRVLLSDLLDRHLPDAAYSPPAAGYLAWIDASRLGLGPDPAEPILDRGRVAVSSGPGFGTQGDGYFRLNIGTSPTLIEAAVTSIAGAL